MVGDCRKELDTFLGNLTPQKLFHPETWKKLPAFVKVVPNGDLLPSRAQYSSVSNDWQVALNYLYASQNSGSEGLWYSLPDVAGIPPLHLSARNGQCQGQCFEK